MSDDRSLIACSRMWVDVDDDDDACCVENVLDNDPLPCIRLTMASSRSFNDLNAASSI